MMVQPPPNSQNEHPLRDPQPAPADDWDDFDTIQGEATPATPPKDDTRNTADTRNANPAPQPKIPPKYTWSEAWTAAITRPRVETFGELLSDTNTSWQRANTWFFLTLCISIFITLAIAFNDPVLSQAFNFSTPDGMLELPQSFIWATLLIATPITAAFGLMIFAGFVFIAHNVAQRFAMMKGRTIDPQRGRLAYSLAVSLAPLNLLSALFLIINIPLIGFALTLYQIYLMVLGIQALYNFEIRDAALTILIPVGGLFVLQLLLLGSAL